MKTAALLAVALLAAAAPASGQSTPPPKEETQERSPAKGPALNLRLDEPSRGAPRITFGAPNSQTKEGDKGLPELGGRPSNVFDRPISPGASGSPIPKDTNPGL